jgi:hypothetical protein
LALASAQKDESKIQEERLKCLRNTPYESKNLREPSNSSANLVNQYSWFFASTEKMESFSKILKSLGRARSEMIKKGGHLANHRGVAVTGNAFAGVGIKWIAELVLHNEMVGLFCAPGATLQTDVGISANFEAIRSISCDSNKHYEGGFFSIGAGVSAEAIGIPLGLETSYSFGIDVKKFVQSYKEAIYNGLFKVEDLPSEISYLVSLPKSTIGPATDLTFLNYALKILSMMDKNVRVLKFDKLSVSPKAIKSMANGQSPSMGEMIKNVNSNQRIMKVLDENRLDNLKIFIAILSSSLTGCDSIGGAGSIGLSLSPVSLGLAYTKYSLLFEIHLEDLNSLTKINLLHFLNPYLLKTQDIRNIIKVARGLIAVPDKVKNQCGVREFLKF